jgi:cytochrome c-type biogenesis protein CcsB
VDDFKQELDDFLKALPSAQMAAKASEGGKEFNREAIERIAQPLQDFEMMSKFAYPLVVPPLSPTASRDQWQNAGNSLLESARSGEIHPAMTSFAIMMAAYRANKPDDFNRALDEYKTWLEPRFGKEVLKGRAEFYYNDVKAFLHAIIIYMCAFLLAGAAVLFLTVTPCFSESLRRSAFYLVLLAGIVHTFGLVFRMVLEGRPPVTNLYSSAIFIGWGTMIMGLIIERIYKVGIGLLVGSFAGFVTLLIAQNLALGGDTMEMLRAVLDTNFWLATHVVVITLGYASTFFAGLLAILYIFLGICTPLLSQKIGKRGSAALIMAGTAVGGGLGAAAAGAVAAAAAKRPNEIDLGKALSKMVYGVICFATLFSFIGTVLGGIWADQSWGRFWGWDPKENGALLIVLWNALILHARWGGLVRDRGIMNLAIFGNIVTSFSWFGVNMLGIGLHSYGFMDSAFKVLMFFIASQVALIGLGLLPLNLWRSFRLPKAAPASPAPGAKGRAPQPVVG